MSTPSVSRSPSPVTKKEPRSPSSSSSSSSSVSKSRSPHSRSRSRSRSPTPKRKRRRSRSPSESRSPSPRRHRRSTSHRSQPSPHPPPDAYGGGYGGGYGGYRGGGRGVPYGGPPRGGRVNQDSAPPNRCLGVFGLSLYTTERDLEDFFSKFGRVSKVQLVYDHPTGRSRGFGFVTFEEIDEAVEAKERAPGTELDGQRIRVDFSASRGPHEPTPGIYMGGAGFRSGPPRPRDPYDDRRYDERRYDDRREPRGYDDRYDQDDEYGQRDRDRRSRYGHSALSPRRRSDSRSPMRAPPGDPYRIQDSY